MNADVDCADLVCSKALSRRELDAILEGAYSNSLKSLQSGFNSTF